jgi:phosphohistidine phosphatase
MAQKGGQLMRELILLRHAHAESAAPGQDDADRPLSRTGQAEAEAAGQWLKANAYVPDRVVCSPARRTRETLEQVLAVVGYVEQRQDARIYQATSGELMAIADEHMECSRVLIVGHNPGFEQLAALLSSGQSGEFRGMPAGGIAVLKLPANAELEPGVAELVAFWWP